MKPSLTLAAACAAFLAAGSATAATLDFVAEAAGNERGIASGETLVIDGLAVTFTSSHNPYFDDLSGGKPGGLGVCKVLTGSKQCTPGNDDNITSGEWVTLSFASRVDLGGLSFTNADHNGLNASAKTLRIGVDGGALSTTSFASAVSANYLGIGSITFAYGGGDPSQFYVNAATATAVPLPAPLALLGGAVAGLAALRRRG